MKKLKDSYIGDSYKVLFCSCYFMKTLLNDISVNDYCKYTQSNITFKVIYLWSIFIVLTFINPSLFQGPFLVTGGGVFIKNAHEDAQHDFHFHFFHFRISRMVINRFWFDFGILLSPFSCD